MRPLLIPLREAAWLNAERATAAGWMLLAGLAFTMAMLFGTSQDSINSRGVPLGGDFTCYYTASLLALRGAAALAYDHAAMRAAEIEVLGGDYGFLPFMYPPLWLLLCLPLALVPYAAAHAAFLGGTALACWRGLRALHSERWAVLPLLAFPAFWSNATYGQNGFLSAALLAGATLHLDKRPAVAGVCFGLLAYKPQLGLAVPLALAATGRWRVFAAAAATALGLAAAATLAFGAGIWAAWLGSAAIGRLGMLLVACTPLLTHYTLEYDLAILAIPMAWLMAEAGRGGGSLPWERLGLAAVFILPMISFQLASATGVQLLPLATAAIFLLVVRRVAADIAAAPIAGRAANRAAI